MNTDQHTPHLQYAETVLRHESNRLKGLLYPTESANVRSILIQNSATCDEAIQAVNSFDSNQQTIRELREALEKALERIPGPGYVNDVADSGYSGHRCGDCFNAAFKGGGEQHFHAQRGTRVGHHPDCEYGKLYAALSRTQEKEPVTA